MFSIKPVFPVSNITRHNTSIAFLGDILENIIPWDKKPFIPGHVSMDNKMDKIQPVEAGFVHIQPQDKESLYLLSSLNPAGLNAGRKKETGRVNFPDFFIKGKARDRIVIYKPELEKITALPSDFSSGFSVNVRFRISKYGYIKYAECITSSGDTEIDQAAVRYVRKWEFVQSAEDNQEGVVRISFK